VTLADLPIARRVATATAAQMAEADRIATLEMQIGVDILMESASRQIAATARVYLGGRVAGMRVVALVGSGNNGADAAGALRHLANWGARVRAECSAPRERQRETTRVQLSRLLLATSDQSVVHDASDGPPRHGDGMPRLEADLILDGLLGYSARGAPTGAVAGLITAANGSSTPIVAVDIPSGLDPDTGETPGAAIRAAVTVTLALPKRGLVDARAGPLVGELVLADIGIPPSAFRRLGIETKGMFTDGDLLRVAR
jgi:NAD(P)H-hydrate epimerase